MKSKGETSVKDTGDSRDGKSAGGLNPCKYKQKTKNDKQIL